MTVRHRIQAADHASAIGLRALIEVRLPGVKTKELPTGWGNWAVEFEAPKDLDLDFLRPYTLPPK